METRGSGLSDVGRKRENNEDAFLVDDSLGLYVVSDGVGGHAAGETASRLAVEMCRATCRAEHRTLQAARFGRGEHVELRRVAIEAVQAACREVHAEATTKPELSGMGCTLTLLIVAGRRGVMAHVGDSRLYLYRDGAAWQLSSDHTIAADLVRRGELTPEQMTDHPYSNALTRAIGGQAAVEPETLIIDVLPDDVFLLCSDGLSTYFDGLGEVSRFLGDSELERAPGNLIALANERGGRDNVTAVVVQAVAGDDESLELASLADDLRQSEGVLREVPLFADLRFADRLRILRIASCRTVEPGEVLVEVGAELSGLFVPVRGVLELVAPGERAKRIGPGSCVGATSVLVPRSSWATLRAIEEATVLVIEGAPFQSLVRRRPWLGVSLMSALARALGDELAETGRRVYEDPEQHFEWWDPRGWL